MTTRKIVWDPTRRFDNIFFQPYNGKEKFTLHIIKISVAFKSSHNSNYQEINDLAHFS